MMIRATAHQSEAYSQSVRLLRELHLLDVDGNGDSTEADEIRTEMELRWPQLTPLEKTRLEGLSVDLYSLGEKCEPLTSSSNQDPREFQQAIDSEDWDKALSLLRRQRDLSAADVAAFRGVAWRRLAHDEIAALFYAEAFRLQPHNLDFKASYLRALVRAGCVNEAKAMSLDRIDASEDPYDVLLASEILFDCAMQQRKNSESELRRVIDLIKRGLSLLKTTPSEPRLKKCICSAYLELALSYDELGDRLRAVEAYEQALRTGLLNSEFAEAQKRSPVRPNLSTAEFHEIVAQARERLGAESTFPLSCQH